MKKGEEYLLVEFKIIGFGTSNWIPIEKGRSELTSKVK